MDDRPGLFGKPSCSRGLPGLAQQSGSILRSARAPRSTLPEPLPGRLFTRLDSQCPAVSQYGVRTALLPLREDIMTDVDHFPADRMPPLRLLGPDLTTVTWGQRFIALALPFACAAAYFTFA